MLNCEEAARLMSLAQEKKLSRWERIQLRFHNLICPPCDYLEKNLGFLRKLSQEHSNRDPEGK